MPKGNTIHIHYVCSHEAPLGCLPCNSLLWYAIFPLGQSKHYYPVCASQCWYHNLWNSRRASGLSHAPSSVTDRLPLHLCHTCTSYPDPVLSAVDTCGHIFPSSSSSLFVMTYCLYHGLFIPLIFFVCLLVQYHILFTNKEITFTF